MTAVEMFLWRFLDKNVTVSVVILMVLAARLVLRRFPKKYAYALWGIVGIRMLVELPVRSVFSVFHLLPFERWMRQAGAAVRTGTAVAGAAEFAAQAGTAAVDFAVQPGVATTDGAVTAAAGLGPHAMTGVVNFAAQTAAHVPSGFPLAVFIQHSGLAEGILLAIYLVGISIVLVIGEISYLRFRNSIRQAVHLREDIWECDRITTPFVLGFVAPKIYIPFHLDQKSRIYVVEHERQHIRRGDLWVKLFAYLLLAMYWVNPLAWVAYSAFVRDQEMSCDEAVIRMFGNGSKQEYSELLLSFAVGHKVLGFYPIAFGESDAARRIKNVLHYRSPGFRMAIVGVTLIGVLAAGCLTNDVQEEKAGGEGENVSDRQVAESTKSSDGQVVSDKSMMLQARLEELAVIYENVEVQKASRLEYDRKQWEEWGMETGDFDAWAKAVAGKDTEKVLELATEETLQQMETEGLVVRQNGREGIRTLSGPKEIWTKWDQDAYKVVKQSWSGKTGTAVIYYTVPEQDTQQKIHLVSCRENVKGKREWGQEKRLEICGEQMICYDSITDRKCFQEAYEEYPLGAMWDYAQNGYGELLYLAAMKEPDTYKALFEPAAAARYLLNLSADEDKVQVSSAIWTHEPSGEVTVALIRFVAEDRMIAVKMIQPWGEGGIWIPQYSLFNGFIFREL
ncbi:MAG: hypothetical protein IJ794_18875 [Lachnospiraceae bacterium]|nr:hypothetical protein [Lachnospiraceae bacterium]